MRVALTDIVIRKAAPPERGSVALWDTVTPGLCLRVSSGGAKAFCLVLGRRRERTAIGRYPIISLAEARGEAKRLIAERTLGARRAPAVPFDEALGEFFATHCDQHHRPATAKETKRLLTKHFLPKLGSHNIGAVTTQDINRILDKLLDTPSECLHSFRAIRLFYRWATRRGYVDVDPVARIAAPAKERPRDRVLTDEEIGAIWNAADLYGPPFGFIIQLLILTGARRSEIGELRTEYIDLEQRTITLPAELTKNGRRHSFPIGDMTSDLLKRSWPASGLFFPARRKSEPFRGYSSSKVSFDKICKIAPWTLHDLRRTFATNLAALGTPIHVTEKLLNHVSGTAGGIVGVYQRHAYFDEMRQAVEVWERRLGSVLGPPNR